MGVDGVGEEAPPSCLGLYHVIASHVIAQTREMSVRKNIPSQLHSPAVCSEAPRGRPSQTHLPATTVHLVEALRPISFDTSLKLEQGYSLSVCSTNDKVSAVVPPSLPVTVTVTRRHLQTSSLSGLWLSGVLICDGLVLMALGG